MTTPKKQILVLNESTTTLVNLDGYLVLNKQYGPMTWVDKKTGETKETNGYRVTAHYAGGAHAVLCNYSDEAEANGCIQALIHYILTGNNQGETEQKDLFTVRDNIKEPLIISVANSKPQAGPLSLIK